jgi:SAM-dependent methyltransferase
MSAGRRTPQGHEGIEPDGTYRPQYHVRWRGLARMLDHAPRVKAYVAGLLRRGLRKVFEPGMVTTERVVEYPFVFQNLPGARGPVLDVGCCHSRMPVALAARGFRVVGIDVAPYPYAHPGMQAVQCDVMRIPFASRSFSAVLAISVIEHIGIGHYQDPSAAQGDQAAMAELARVLKPDGRLLLSVPFGAPLTNDFMRVYDPPRLRALLAPFRVRTLEYAKSSGGLWAPCEEREAVSVDWEGPNRAVALVVAEPDGSAAGCGS